MCEFFSVLVEEKGGKLNLYYHDNAIRKQVLKGDNPNRLRIDSHASIAEYHFNDSTMEDKLWKYEYNPLTKKLNYDGRLQMKPSEQFDKRVLIEIQKLDFKTIVPELVIKDIIHPFKNRNFDVDIEEIRSLVKKWDSVRASVRGSVRGFVGDSVWASVSNAIWASVSNAIWASVGYSVWDSVWDSVGASAWGSVWASVRASIGDSVRAYMSSFFILKDWLYIEHKKGENPFQCMVDLWDIGVIPVFLNDEVLLVTDKGLIARYERERE